MGLKVVNCLAARQCVGRRRIESQRARATRIIVSTGILGMRTAAIAPLAIPHPHPTRFLGLKRTLLLTMTESASPSSVPSTHIEWKRSEQHQNRCREPSAALHDGREQTSLPGTNETQKRLL